MTTTAQKLAPFLVMFLIVISILSPVSAQDPFVPTDAIFSVNTDGFVHVEYTLAIDTTFPRIEVALFGDSYENLIVTSEEGSGLDFSLAESVLTIDSLGASTALISYDTPDLTSKTGSLWTLTVISPVDATVRLPESATIVSLNTVPAEITITNGLALRMPLGVQEITYVLTFAEARQRALAMISLARTDIENAQSEGRISGLMGAQALLAQAESSFNSANYGEAEKLGIQASTLAKATVAGAVPATEDGGQQGSFGAIPLETLVPIAAVIVVLGAFLALKWRKGSRKSAYTEDDMMEIDTKKLFDQKSELRSEDREVVEFIAQRGGRAVESEIRDHFKLPKTTVWRMMKRLRNEGIADIYRIGNQNLVKINPKYRKTTLGVP